MRNLILAGMILLTSFSCKKPPDKVPGGNNIDYLVGAYIGENKHDTSSWYVIPHNPGMPKDSVVSKDSNYVSYDTLIINKITADSFTISGEHWKVNGQQVHFAFNDQNKYSFSYSNYTLGGSMSVHFFGDSVSIEKADYSSHWTYSYTHKQSFRAKK